MHLLTRQLAPSQLLPLTLAEAERHCRLGEDEDSDYLTALIRAVAALFERESKQALMLADYVSVVGQWSTVIFLPYRIAAITKVEYVDEAGAVQLLPAERSSIGIISPDAFILSGIGPAVTRSSEAIRIYYTAGYTSPEEVPADIKQWLLLTLLHFYENRQPSLLGLSVQEVPMSAKYIMNLIREPTL